MAARDLLRSLQEIERSADDERPYLNAPRTLDLDLILFGAEVINEPDLIVPHPRFRERRFVLESASRARFQTCATLSPD